MYSYIKGVLTKKQNEYIVIETGGIGYKISTALTTIQAAGDLGNELTVFTHLHVREDAMSLFGFITQEELNMFELLISVSGVGPKAAISLISSLPPSKFGISVITNDYKTLTKAQGIGGKTAQRIVLELKDKIKKEQISALDLENIGDMSFGDENSTFSEAISALMVLGYSPAEASKSVSSVYKDEMDLETIIKSALKII